MNCPICNSKLDIRFVVKNEEEHITYRRLHCTECGSKFWSEEHLILKDNEDLKYSFKLKDLKCIRKRSKV